MEMATFGAEKTPALLCLSDRFQFYIDGRLVTSRCYSYVVHDAFVVMTTLG